MYRRMTQNPQLVMVWTGISAKGRTPLIFVPVEVKVDCAIYQKLILDPVVIYLTKTMLNKEPFLFKQDGAPAYTSSISQSWLRKIFRISFLGGMASTKSRFESHGLLNLVHIGDKNLYEVTFKCWNAEEVSSLWVAKNSRGYPMSCPWGIRQT